MTSFVISAPGKLHLLGEHTVVYGKPALLAAMDKRCFVKITPHKNRSIVIKLKDIQEQFETNEKEILRKTEKAQNLWKDYKKNPEKNSLRAIAPTSIDFIVIALGESLQQAQKYLPCGFTLEITSEIPVGSGMGSSAAVAVAIAGAMSFLFINTLDTEFIAQSALRAEQRVHGNPSGGDTATSIAGGVVWFEKGIATPIASQISPAFQKNFPIIFTGKPDETTGEMVEMVRKAYEENPEKLETIFNNQERLTYALDKALHEENSLVFASILKQGEKNLEDLGVVSKSTKKLIRKIEGLGGAAKICGAGGRKGASGMVLICGIPIAAVKKELGINAQQIVFGEKGVVKER